MAAKEANIKAICLPPHTSGALQPLDVSVFKPMKSKWRKILNEFFRESDMSNVKKEHFPVLLKKVMKYMKEHPGHLTNGFDKAGLCPLNRDMVPRAKVMLTETVKPIDDDSCSSVEGSTDDKKNCRNQE